MPCIFLVQRKSGLRGEGGRQVEGKIKKPNPQPLLFFIIIKCGFFMIFMALFLYSFFFFMKRKCQLNCGIFSSNMCCCFGSGRCLPISINDYSQHSKKLEGKAPSPSAFDNGSDSNIITAGAETMHEKYNGNVLLISFPNMIS